MNELKGKFMKNTKCECAIIGNKRRRGTVVIKASKVTLSPRGRHFECRGQRGITKTSPGEYLFCRQVM